MAALAQRFLKGEIKHFNALARYEASLNRQYNQAWRELDSRPVADFREVYDPAGEQDSVPEPHYTQPTPEALDWKSATQRYEEAQYRNPGPPPPAQEPLLSPDTPKTPIETTSSGQPEVTAQTKPIPKSDTPFATTIRPDESLSPDHDVPAIIEWVRERIEFTEGHPENKKGENEDAEGLLNPCA